jgi:hypothetical protein
LKRDEMSAVSRSKDASSRSSSLGSELDISECSGRHGLAHSSAPPPRSQHVAIRQPLPSIGV